MIPFAQCPKCNRKWETSDHFNQSINLKEVIDRGFQEVGNDIVGNLYHHNIHSCNTTFIILPNQQHLHYKKRTYFQEQVATKKKKQNA